MSTADADGWHGIEAVHRAEWARLVAALARRFRDLDVAEEAAGEAFLAAVEHWRDGPPPNPGGWLMTTATRRAIHRMRRDARAATDKRPGRSTDMSPEPR
jgi:RNA polymerase sigma-70 factor (ECF subfamily)